MCDQEATEEFKKYHPLSYLEDYLPKDAFLGPVDHKTFGQLRQIKDETSKEALSNQPKFSRSSARQSLRLNNRLHSSSKSSLAA
jgi:hypothetical protein